MNSQKNNIAILDHKDDYTSLCDKLPYIVSEKNLFKDSRKVLGEDVIEILLTGKIITLNNQSSLSISRYYRYNFQNETVEYTDDLITWNKSNKSIKTFKTEWGTLEWLVLDCNRRKD